MYDKEEGLFAKTFLFLFAIYRGRTVVDICYVCLNLKEMHRFIHKYYSLVHLHPRYIHYDRQFS